MAWTAKSATVTGDKSAFWILLDAEDTDGATKREATADSWTAWTAAASSRA